MFLFFKGVAVLARFSIVFRTHPLLCVQASDISKAGNLPPEDIAYQKAHIHDDHGAMVNGVSGFLIAITTIVVGLRFIAKKVRRNPLEWDDWFALSGLIFTILMCVINIVSVHYGLGRHLLATDPMKGYKILQAGWIGAKSRHPSQKATNSYSWPVLIASLCFRPLVHQNVYHSDI